MPIETAPSHPAQWWVMRDDDRIECRLCPRFCKLRDHQHGFCFVRRRAGNRLELATYGRSSGFCIDPIEKKPLHHFLPGTSVLSFGTAGCNLGCRFCQNWDISKAQELDLLGEKASPGQIAATARRQGCRSVAFTYNDPVIFAEYAIDVAAACHDAGIKAVAVTAGYITREARESFFAAMDATNIDLKGFTEEFYHRLCFAQLQPVLDALCYVHRETSVWLEVTTLLIPGQNDTDDELDRMSDWFAGNLGPDVPWHFTAYHPDYKLSAPPTPLATLSRARQLAQLKGIRHVYTGNVRDTAGASTWCPACGQLLIGRDRYSITHWTLAGDRCGRCGWTIPGVFEDAPGEGCGALRRVHLCGPP
jgi:pyruvate formate lyase activating enzyme